MTYILAVFKNRNSSLAFLDGLKSINIQSSIVSNPKELGASCGVSVKLPNNRLSQAQYLLARGRYSSFVGFYKVTKVGERTLFEKIRG